MSDTVSADSIKAQMPHAILTRACCLVCLLIVVWSKAGSRASWRPQDHGGHHDRSIQEIASSRKPLLLLLSAFCAYTANTHHAAIMSQIGGREEVTELGVEATKTTARKPAAMVGGCVFAS